MAHRILTLIAVFWAAALWAYPITDLSSSTLSKPDKTDLDKEWLTSSSFFFNQLKIMPQTVFVPTAPSPGANPAETSTTEPGRPSLFGFRYDLNYDGKLDEFLPLQTPLELGAAYNPERNQTSKLSSKLFALALPSFGPPSAGNENYQLFLQNISASQNIFVVDTAAMARGEAGLLGQAQWGTGKSGLSETGSRMARMTRVSPLHIGWLALLLGGFVILWQRRIFCHPLTK